MKRYEYEVSGELLTLILKQLQKAAGDSELYKQIEEEENALHEFEAVQQALVKKLKQKDKELADKDKELDEKERYIRELEERLKEKGH